MWRVVRGRKDKPVVNCVWRYYDGSSVRPSVSVKNSKANHSKQWVLQFDHCKAIKLDLPPWAQWFISAPAPTVIAQPQFSMEILIRRLDISLCYMVVILLPAEKGGLRTVEVSQCVSVSVAVLIFHWISPWLCMGPFRLTNQRAGRVCEGTNWPIRENEEGVDYLSDQ